MEKDKFKKRPGKLCFCVVGNKTFFFQTFSLEKYQNTICFRRRKNANLVDTICFWKMSLFCDHLKSPTLQRNRGFRGWHFWFERGCLWEGSSKRVFTICDTHRKLRSAGNTFFRVVSAKHSFAKIKDCKLKDGRNLPKFRGCLQTCKKFSFGFFWWFWFFVIVFVFLRKEAPKAIFLQF